MVDRVKRETRARMAQTGERYTTARRHVVSSHNPRPPTDAVFNVAVAGAMARNDTDDLLGEELEERLNDYLEGEGNPWRLNLEELLLELDDGTYEVALDDCRTSAGVLDSIIQVAVGAWATDAIIAGLVRALDVVLDPQTHLCHEGKEQGPTDWLPEDVEVNVRMSGAV